MRLSYDVVVLDHPRAKASDANLLGSEKRLITAAEKLLPIGEDLLNSARRKHARAGEDLLDTDADRELRGLAQSMLQSVNKSFRSVLVLASHSLSEDSIRVARSMFEAAITLGYLTLHPDDVNDYMDFKWVIQHKRYEYLKQHCPQAIPNTDPGPRDLARTEFERVKPQFTDKKGRIRSGWTEVDLHSMAKEQDHAVVVYDELYRFSSSFVHVDALASAVGDVRSKVYGGAHAASIVGIQFAVIGFEMTLKKVDEICGAGMSDAIASALDEFWKGAASAGQ